MKSMVLMAAFVGVLVPIGAFAQDTGDWKSSSRPSAVR